MIVLPKEALRFLTDVATSNFINQGELVETLAFLLAVKDGVNDYTITDVILPTQSSSGVFVEDQGINNQDSAVFMHSLCTQHSGKIVFGWFHTHVRGTPVMLSAIDCHTQYQYESAVFSGIKAFVMELPSQTLDCYELTEVGSSSLCLCNLHFPWKANIQHTECFQSAFYRSLKHHLVQKDTAVTLIDARQSQPFSQPVGTYEKFICGNKSLSIQRLGDCQASPNLQSAECAFVCNACGKTFRDLKTKSRHLKRTKCDESSESAFLQPAPAIDVKTFLDKPCVKCSATFQNHITALQHFSRSPCKTSYQTVLAERRRLKRCEYYHARYHPTTLESQSSAELIAKEPSLLKYRESLQQSLKRKYQERLKDSLKRTYQERLKDSLKRKYQEKLKESLKRKYQERLKQSLRRKYDEKLKHSLRRKYDEKLKHSLRIKYDEKLKHSLRRKYQESLRQSLKRKYQEVFKQSLKRKYQESLKESLKSKYQESLKGSLRKKYQNSLKEPLQIKYRECLKEPLRVKYQNSLKQSSQLKYRVCKSLKQFDEFLKEFRRIMCLGLTFESICCERLHFENGVTQLSENTFSKLDDTVVARSISAENLTGSKVMCHYCHRSLRKGEKPSLSTMNGLTVESIPEGLRSAIDSQGSVVHENFQASEITHACVERQGDKRTPHQY